MRVSGTAAVSITRRVLDAELRPRRATLAKAVDPLKGGALLDRVVATWFPAPRSATGEDVVEIACHGSPFIRSRLLELLHRHGARPARPGEFTFRAFRNGKLDLAQAEAVARLIASRSAAAHRAALAALEGGLSRRAEALRDRILAARALLEVSIDHPDEDVPAADPAALSGEIRRVEGDVRNWLERSPAARLLDEGPRIVLVGAPNVGKSSLLNALLGRDRAIVHEAPGTTRDVLDEPAILGGLPAVLVDTAGLRGGRLDPVEEEGMDRTRRALSASDLALVVLDSSRPLGDADRKVEAEAASRCPARLLVLNKSDLPQGPACAEAAALGVPAVRVSALTRDGLEDLIATLRVSLAGTWGAEEAPAATDRVRQALAECADRLGLAAETAGSGELAAVHLRASLEALGRLVGGGQDEDLLDTVFSKFCIGK